MEEQIIQNSHNTLNEIFNFLNVSEVVAESKRNKSNEGWKLIQSNNGIFAEKDPRFKVTIEDIEFMMEVFKDERASIESLLDIKLTCWKEIDDALIKYVENCKNYKKHLIKKSLGEVEKKAASAGLFISSSAVKACKESAEFEAPVRLGNAKLMHKSSVGAFTYTADGFIYNTDIGRYCSIARGVNIGQANHPMETFSTSPVFFQKTFNYKTSVDYSYDSIIEHMSINEDINKVARKVARPRTSIGHDVWIGNDVKIIAGVTIGNGAVIGAGAVVTKDVAPYEIVGGVPAKHIKYRFSKEIISDLEKLCWWNYAPWDLMPYTSDNINSFIENVKKAKSKKMLLQFSGAKISFQ